VKRAKTVLTVLTVWTGVSVLLAPLVGKVLKVKLGQQALLDPLEVPVPMGWTGEMGLAELQDRSVRPDPVGLQGLAGTTR